MPSLLSSALAPVQRRLLICRLVIQTDAAMYATWMPTRTTALTVSSLSTHYGTFQTSSLLSQRW